MSPKPSGAPDTAEMARIAAGYRSFAVNETPGRSPLYSALAEGVSNDAAVLALLATLPPGKRQPNLVFAALRVAVGTPSGYGEFRTALLDEWQAIEPLIFARRTQTNEVARCATLLPVLSALPQPLALVEVGASAGLCLLLDRYAYDYGGHRIGDSSLVLSCAPGGHVPLPASLPAVVWRAGLDLDPIDCRDPEQVAWLRALVWPGQEYRLDRLDAALRIAVTDPPPVHRGDLRKDLPELIASAPREATLVVFHSAVLAYVPRGDRQQFVQVVSRSRATWVSNEAPTVFDGIVPVPAQPSPRGAFLLSADGVARGWADPHGARLDWLE